MRQNNLYYHGIKGMKWGVRRYQNPDGSLTEEGLWRYRSKNHDKTKDDVENILSTLTPNDKTRLGMDPK